jgi:hypothetical protein
VLSIGSRIDVLSIGRNLLGLMMLQRRVFVSMVADRVLSKAQNDFKWAVVERIEQCGYQVEIFFNLRALAGAKETFETLRQLDPIDLQANYRLGTIYQKLAESTMSVEAKLAPLRRLQPIITIR